MYYFYVIYSMVQDKLRNIREVNLYKFRSFTMLYVLCESNGRSPSYKNKMYEA